FPQQPPPRASHEEPILVQRRAALLQLILGILVRLVLRLQISAKRDPLRRDHPRPEGLVAKSVWAPPDRCVIDGCRWRRRATALHSKAELTELLPQGIDFAVKGRVRRRGLAGERLTRRRGRRCWVLGLSGGEGRPQDRGDHRNGQAVADK